MRSTTWVAGAVLTSSLLLVGNIACAEDGKGALTVALENDLFGAGTDEHYTHGSEITYVSDTYQPDWVRSMASLFGIYDSDDDLRVGVSIGQQMFTPSDISRTDLIVDDRPYAGWLYASFGLLTDSKTERVRNINKLELVVGVVGPESRAEVVQRKIHNITDSKQPEGWDNQLHNETTVDVQYQHEWIVPIIDNYIDVVPRVAASLGTSQRYAGTGLTLRFGSGLNADAGPPLIRPTAAGSQYFTSAQSFYWYLFAGAHGRYVAHDIFLDGNTDGDSHSVDKKEWIGEAQGGVVMGWQKWRLTVTEIYRSRAFDGQEDPDEFGSIAVSYRF